jgi:hypothetical protein
MTEEYSLDEDRKRRRKKDPHAPKNPVSAYLFYVAEQRVKNTGKSDGKSFAQVAKDLGKQWKNLSNDEKQPYIDMARKDKQRYEREKADYKVIQVNRASESSHASAPHLSMNNSQGLVLPSEIEVSLPPNTHYVPGWIPHPQFAPYMHQPHLNHLPANMNMSSGSFSSWNYYPPAMYGNMHPGFSSSFINYGSNVYSQQGHPMPLNVNYGSHLTGFSSGGYPVHVMNSQSISVADTASNSGAAGSFESASLQCSGEESKTAEPTNSDANNAVHDDMPSCATFSDSEVDEFKKDGSVK